jgi:hypothetical protein
MRTRLVKVTVVLAVCAALFAAAMVPALAIPVFSRKYGFGCAACHSNWPRLNDFGLRYRQNGYQIPTPEFAGVLRFDLVNTPAAVTDDISRWTIAGRYYLTQDLAVHLEYSNFKQSQAGMPRAQENSFSTRLDFAF